MKDEKANKGDFTHNKDRDCSYKFGKKPVKKLLKDNDMLSILRAHQVQQEGFKMHRWGSNCDFPSVITIFSAPNYCGSYNNKGAVLILSGDALSLK